MIENLEIYISKITNPYINIATEKYLLDTVSASTCILYLWQNENTVVIGRNQNVWNECRCKLLEAEGGFVARRLSGGGAVFHDIGNLNFTFICSSDNYNLQKQLRVIQTACRMASIPAEISGRNDILANGRKFSGNAFYNTGHKSCHHGTILISTDADKLQRYLTPPKAKLEAKGIKSVRSRTVNLSELAPTLTCADMTEYMSAAFSEVYKMKASLCEIPENGEIQALANEFSSREYIYNTSHPFTATVEDYFPWGHISISMDVRGGIIENVKIYTDSVDWELSEKAENALHGCPFDTDAMIKATSFIFL